MAELGGGRWVDSVDGDKIAILLIDDDPLVQRLVARALDQAGYAVSTVASAAEALVSLGASPPDLVLLDVGLPDLDGFGVCREIRKRHSSEELPVLMLTGQQDDAAIEAAFGAGATDFLAKPVSVPLLLQRMRFALRASGAFQRVLENEQRLARGHELAGIGQFEWHLDAGRLDFSPQALRILGSPATPPRTLEAFVEGYVQAEDRGTARAILSGESYVEAELRLARDGESRTVRIYVERNARPSGTVLFVTMHDVTELVGDRRHKLGYYDSVTGLPNRQLFESRLDAAFREPSPRRFAVLFADVDGFKAVNDSRGHLAGDELLRHVAARLLASVRVNDPIGRLALHGSVGRWGGDEFAALVGPIGSRRDAELVAQRILENAAPPIELAGREHDLRLSVGIAIFPEHGKTRHELLRSADRAMYEAKRAGGGGFRVYEPLMDARASRRSSIESDLPGALRAGQLRLAYQPRFALDSMGIRGAEALLRWTHPTLGAVAPDEFIPVAERNQAILPIGRWVIEEASAELARWLALGPADLSVSVNVSPLQLREPDFVQHLSDALVDAQIAPRQLELEITESMMLDRTEAVGTSLRLLAELGVGIAVDDFGTGYSSLGALLSVPLTAVKLDRSIVTQIERSANARGVVRAIVAMCRGMGCRLVAEGVESEQEAQILGELGCLEAQGFWFCEPIEADKLVERLRSAPR